MIIYLFISAHSSQFYLITYVHKIFDLHLNLLNYKNALKKPAYIIFFMENKNIWPAAEHGSRD